MHHQASLVAMKAVIVTIITEENAIAAKMAEKVITIGVGILMKKVEVRTGLKEFTNSC